ncbi:MAG TPA: LytTR family transcriptional regulator [Flavobacteriaceae bacterium]|nr:LytTR family transcriptional regulator [Flavobacteriaceae bacterium]|tara:strand:- start:102296 stop:102520 length:225 start_codon:yes stop_codon:yes gene_type:complete
MKKNTNSVNSTKGMYLKNNDHLEYVGFPDILYLKGENNYCTVYAKSGDYLYNESLKEVAAQLPKNLFIQSHSNY